MNRLVNLRSSLVSTTKNHMTEAMGLLFVLTIFLLSICCPAVTNAADDDQEIYRLMLANVRGNLTVTGEASTPTYTAYFHIPVPTKYQTPLVLEVNGNQLIDYRIMRTSGHNLLVAAEMNSAQVTNLDWEAWVLIDQNYFSDIPSRAPIPVFEDLPDSVKPFLQPTATAQVDCYAVQDWVEENNDNPYLVGAALLVNSRCMEILPLNFSMPSFDAHIALTRGSSCTGHAHAATALLRALQVPARTKLALLTWYDAPYDMHWTSDYFVPDYDWVGMDTTTGTNPLPTVHEVVIYSCEPGDEFPLFFSNGIDGFWHSSDKSLGVGNPAWAGAHQCESYTYATGSQIQKDQVMALARETFNFEVDYRGINLPESELASLEAGRMHLALAQEDLLDENFGDAIDALTLSVMEFSSIAGGTEINRYNTDFEDAAPGWSHGGIMDEWELGIPESTGPESAHSAANCWGTNLDGTYGASSNSWLLSPPIDLTGLISAQLEFWIYNLVQGGYCWYNMGDYSWLEITTDGEEFLPFCSAMRGGSHSPAIPLVAGWSQMDLDLTPYVGETVQIRFHFWSDGANTRPGTYIDDVKVSGRELGISAVPHVDSDLPGNILSQEKIFPNPFNPQTQISFELSSPQRVRISVFDMNGRRVTQIAERAFGEGPQSLDWNGRDMAGRLVPSGTYLLRIDAGQETWHGKMMLVR